MDGNDELFQNPEVKTLFKCYEYECICTDNDSSFQIESIKRSHRIVYTKIK